MTLPLDQAILRFEDNEERIHTFVNDETNVGFYVASDSSHVKTLPALADEAQAIIDGYAPEIDELVYIKNEQLSSGLVSGGAIIPTDGVGGFYITPGVGYRRDVSGVVRRVTWGTLSDTCILDGTNTICVTDDGFGNGSLTILSSADTSNIYIGLGAIQMASGNTVGLSSIATVPLSDFQFKVANFSSKVFGAIVVDGCTVAEQATPNELKLTRSDGITVLNFVETPMAQTSTFSKIVNCSDYGLIPETATTADTVTIGYYNDVTEPAVSCVVPMTSGWWKKDMIFSTIEGVMFYMYGQQQYATEADAIEAPVPYLPPEVSFGIVKSCSIVSSTASTSIASGIYDIRPYFARIFEGGAAAIPAVVIDHGALTGLGDDDHTQYHNDSRGDVRYYPRSNVDTLLAAKEPSITSGSTSQYWRGDKTMQTLDKSAVGLSNVDNTSDSAKPVSLLQASADATVLTSAQTYADNKIIDSIADGDLTHAPSRNAVFDALALKITANVAITGATKTKITYDAKGLVTAGTDATTADINDSTNRRYVTDAQQTVLSNTSGTNTGDQNLSGLMSKSANLSDVSSVGTARTNLGLGSLATQNGTFSGTSSGTNTGDDKTALTGLLKGDGSVMSPAVAGTDYVAPNASVLGATKTKITYDAKGLVTSGADATTADISDSTNKRYITDAQQTVLSNTSGTNTGDQTLGSLGAVPTSRTINGYALTSNISLAKSDVGLGSVDNTSDIAKPVSTAQQTALDLKLDKNTLITGNTKTKITYDAKGLVTSGADATTADITDSTDKRYITDAQQTVLSNTSGTNTGDQDLSPYFDKSSDDTDDISEGTTNKFSTTAEKTKVAFISVTQAVDLDSIETDTATNNAKVSNAVHTGEVLGGTTLTVSNTLITNKSNVSAAFNDKILVADTSDSDNLKYVTAQSIADLGATGNSHAFVSAVDFGPTFTDKAQTVVTGQGWLVAATSNINITVGTPAGVDPDEMYLLNFRPVVSDLIDGVGFTITVYSETEAKGIYPIMCVGV